LNGNNLFPREVPSLDAVIQRFNGFRQFTIRKPQVSRKSRLAVVDLIS